MQNINLQYKKYTSETFDNLDGISLVLEFYGPNDSEVKILGASATKNIATYILQRVKKEIPELLTSANFYGEAETYMAENNVPFSSKIRQQYAEAIREDFMSSLDLTVQYKEDDEMIYISPYVFSLEYGDFYRPALNYLSSCINSWLSKINESSIIE